MAGRHWPDYLPPGSMVERLEDLRTLLWWYRDCVGTSAQVQSLIYTVEHEDLPAYAYLKQDEFVDPVTLGTLAERYEREHPFPRKEGL